MSNTDDKAKAFLARLIRLEEEKQANATDRRELLIEMKSAELLQEEIAGIKLAVRRHFETDEKRTFRESAEEFAVALGEFRDTPLGDAAIRHVKNDPGVRRAMKKGEKLKAELDRLHTEGITLSVRRSPTRGAGSEVVDRLVEAGVPVVGA